jgi:hypothetical protein
VTGIKCASGILSLHRRWWRQRVVVKWPDLCCGGWAGAIEAREQGFDPKPEIMVPLVGMKQELELVSEPLGCHHDVTDAVLSLTASDLPPGLS